MPGLSRARILPASLMRLGSRDELDLWRQTQFYQFVPSSILVVLAPKRMPWPFGSSSGSRTRSNVLDYIEGQGQVLAYYVKELRSRKWHPVCYLPHDGINANNITGKRYRDHLEEAGFDVVVIPNQGRGAAMQRA